MIVLTSSKGDMESHIAKIDESLKKNETVVFSANCEIIYSGRAESFLAEGDRIIMIKPDKTLIIHQPIGSSPVNYMKENTEHRITSNEEGTFLRSRNIALKEWMDIKLNRIYFSNAYALEDGQKLQLSGTEKDMSDMLYARPDLIEPGFKAVSREEQTRYGFLDVFGHDRDGNLVIIECKRYNADLGAVTQLRRYVEKMKQSKGTDKIRGIMAAPKISSNALKMLQDWGFEYKIIKPPMRYRKFDKKQKSLGEY